MAPKDEQKKAQERIDPKVKQEALNLAHEMEEEKVPSDQHILEEHKHLVEHEEGLKDMLSPINIAPLQDLGKWEPGKDIVEEFPRIGEKKKKR